jgi:hypothetical protein
MGDASVEETLVGLKVWQVPAVTTLTVSVGPPLPPGEPEEPTPSPKTPVPLPVEVC